AITVAADPSTPESPAQTAARVKTLLHVRDDISSVSDMANQIEWLRKQLQTVESTLKADKKSDHGKTLQAVNDMDKKIQDLENQLFSPALANSDEKSYLAPYGLYLYLTWLNGELSAAQAQYHSLMQQDLPRFDQMLIHEDVFPLVGGARGGG